MPSTAVASRQNSWKKIAWKYPRNRKDASALARREREKVMRERERQQRKANKKK